MFIIALNSMLALFVIMFVGFSGTKLKIFSESTNDAFNKLLLNVTAPAMFISAMNITMEPHHIEKGTIALIGGFVFHFIALIIAIVIVKLFKVKSSSIWMFCLTFSNISFLGFPLINNLFGSEALFYASLINVSFYVLVFSMGVVLMTIGKQGEVSVKMILSSKAFLGVIIGVVIFFAPFTLPDFLAKSVKMLGDITPGLSMLLAGATLANTKLMNALTNYNLYILSFIKLIVIPLAVYIIAKLLVNDDELIVILTILAGTPSAVMSVVLARKYNNNPIFVSEIIFMTTTLSVVTLPIIVFIITI